jgi:hypothetical protein
MNTTRSAESLRRVLTATMLLFTTVALMMTSLPRTATAGGVRESAGTPLEVRELPMLTADLQSALNSPEVMAALGGPADLARAKAVELGPDRLSAAWAPSSFDPKLAVAVARASSGELRVVAVREESPGTARVETGGGSITLGIQPGGDGGSVQVLSQTSPAAALAPYWDCVRDCFVSRAVACAAPCLDCRNSGFTQCDLCYACLGYWAVFCATSCR